MQRKSSDLMTMMMIERQIRWWCLYFIAYFLDHTDVWSVTDFESTKK